MRQGYPLEKNSVGVGLRAPHYEKFLQRCPSSVSWAEVVSENYMSWTTYEAGSSLDTLLEIRKNIPISLHGVSLSIGSTDPMRMDYLNELKFLIDAIEPISVSDHLCWTSSEGVNTHDLLPLPYNKETVNWVCDRVDFVQNFLGRNIFLENISSYVQFGSEPLAEAQAISEIVKKSGCGILLDVNNIYVNSINHDYNPKDYLQYLPLDKVCHVHLAGHSLKDDILIDTHDSLVSHEVWELYRYLHNIKNDLPVMIERDDHIPEWEELNEEIQIIHTIHEEKNLEFVTKRIAEGV